MEQSSQECNKINLISKRRHSKHNFLYGDKIAAEKTNAQYNVKNTNKQNTLIKNTKGY